MAVERLSMRKIKEVLPLHAAGLSARAISESLRISHSTINDYDRRIKAAYGARRTSMFPRHTKFPTTISQA